MEKLVKTALGTTVLKGTGKGGGGCINEGEIYHTDNGTVFIKRNSKAQAYLMFEGEFASLQAIESTSTVRVPKPLVVVDIPNGGAVLVMENLEMRGLHKFDDQLGTNLAALHLANLKLMEGNLSSESRITGTTSCVNVPVTSPITEFGFEKPTCCGFIPQNNDWCSDWVTFYARKLDDQIKMISAKYSDREACALWSTLQKIIPSFFEDIEVKPSLLHGDLWSGNVSELESEPVIFDPASFYGHHEYDLAIASIFGGFGLQFWNAYHRMVPKAPGWDRRHDLYILFHQLNHWNHFGGEYKAASLKQMKKLCK